MNKVYIHTGPVQTGKTTRLMHWASSQKMIDGIFQPVIDEKRFIYHISSRTLKQLEGIDKENSIAIGKYLFSKEVFEWAQNVLLECLSKELEWLVIDEIGPLELEGRGLEPAITKIFIEREKFDGNILFVVREGLVKEFVKKYNIYGKCELLNLGNEDQEQEQDV